MFNVIILGLTSFFTDIASEMVYPLIPFFLTVTLGASPAVLGLIEGVAESTASLLKVFSGYISDKLRKRKVLAITGCTKEKRNEEPFEFFSIHLIYSFRSGNDL